ncbi:unnamed protein product [Rotaria sp. Silwood1]|nr:unnamed protein product [Rotaria sp. Silwood1]CAF1418227.1 unnamed protein product [Rotaria sp. Silwood1]CAF1419428.1 unnamed protein product [Rotaria sp. Silwood1]CAF3534845.1 unnamed protein product [Rotaria sp. Silwood1]CAF3559696.1 unnamed protein product [Rotaria sp. Silwood1]
MQRRTEFEKDMRRTPPSPSPRFSRTFDLLLSRFPDSTDLSVNSNHQISPIMASNRDSFQSSKDNEKSGNQPGQWRASISAPLCAFCNKTVYPAEETIGAGQKFHKLCLKCTSCHILLNSRSLNERDKKLYCVGCYSRLFGPRVVSRSLATSFPSNLDTPPSSPSSNREDIDFNSELPNMDDHHFYHKISMHSSPSNISSDEDSRNSNLKSTIMSETTTQRTKPNVNRPTSTSVLSGTAFKMMSISGNICPRCSKTVYVAEEIKAAGKSFHRQCYTCAHCKGTISGAHYSEHDGELYDNKCYQRLFSPRVVLSIGNLN